MSTDGLPRRVFPPKGALRELERLLGRRPGNWFLDMESDSFLSLKGGSGECLSLRTPHQLVEVIRLDGFGLCMILDGRIQLAESDEWVYHELLVHPACAIHGDPRRVIVLGGGDGCAARELLKYSSLTDITVVDIDEQVVELFRDRFSFLNRGALRDPRVRVVCADAMEHLRSSTERYDLIISDLTEPFDPAQAGGDLSRHLYSHESFRLFVDRLTPAGILVCQTGGLLLQPAHDRFHLEILPAIRSHFPHVGVGYEFVPSFGELWTITLGSSRPLQVTPAQVDRSLRRWGVVGLRYYDGSTHRRAFCPPRFARERRR